MISTRSGASPRVAQREGEQKKWYYRRQTYKKRRVKGKSYYVYNWQLIGKEAQKQIRRFVARGISANARKLYYNLWDAGKFPCGDNPYKALDNFLVDERRKGHIKWAVLKDVGRETEEDYRTYYTPYEHLDSSIDNLRNVADHYYYPRWYKQPNYCEHARFAL